MSTSTSMSTHPCMNSAMGLLLMKYNTTKLNLLSITMKLLHIMISHTMTCLILKCHIIMHLILKFNIIMHLTHRLLIMKQFTLQTYTMR